MEIRGSIRPAGTAPFDKAVWCEFIQKRPELRSPAPREGINPFTKKPVLFRSRKDEAEIMLNGVVIGGADWSQSEEPLINVSVEASGLPLVQELASALGGTFVADPAS
jgi:hypothetical protein